MTGAFPKKFLKKTVEIIPQKNAEGKHKTAGEIHKKKSQGIAVFFFLKNFQ